MTDQTCSNSTGNTISLKLYLPDHAPEAVKEAVDKVLDNADVFAASLYQGENGWMLSYGEGKISECDIEKERSADWVEGYMDISDRLRMDAERRLYRANVFPLTGGGVLLYVRFHHIIMDGHGMSLFVQRVLDVLAGKEIEPSVFNVGEVADLEDSPNDVDEKEFWKSYFLDADFEAAVFSRKTDGTKFSSYRDSVPDTIMQAVESYGEKENISIPCLFAAAYAFYLAQATDKKDAVFLMPCLNRTLEQMDTLGCYTLFVPVRVRVDAEDTFAELCRKVKTAAGEASAHSICGFHYILTVLREENMIGESISEYMFYFYQFSFQTDLRYKARFGVAGNMPNHLTFSLLRNEKGGLDLQFDYQEGIYTEKGARNLCEAVITILLGGVQGIG
ncbi:MAG: condensation domain-containing protein [Lachnospiraceae bacterium]|nr:condensation domain-containing protein [Butyrivibrio sp.]MCM1344988.1 condensation domain-containing protein [Muribaculaceae bacterium]MCM1412161.1 condensation domain-containing protein [Lachnospiraceae bacterium]